MNISTPLTSPLVETEWLQGCLGDSSLRILDCSVAGKPKGDGTYSFIPQYDEWERAHIPGSIFVDIPEQLSDKSSEIGLMMPPVAEFAATMRQLGIGDDTTVILYDSSNHAWAARVWWMLRVIGFDNAAVLNGGLRKWKAEDRDLAEGHFAFPEAESLGLNHRPHLMLDRQQIMDVLGNNEVILLNSLPRPIFTGEVAPYGRAGHIPGSCNLSCESIIDPDSFNYLEEEVLRQMVADSGALAGKEVITYCGGGIAASSTALILTQLGVKNISMYDGSLSEWCRDPQLPLETCLAN